MAASPRARRLAAGAAVLGLLLAGLWLLGRRTPPPPPPPPAPAPAPAAAPAPPPAKPPLELKVVTAAGSVERSRNGGGWAPLSTGDVLGLDEQVRAGPGGRAELDAGGRGRLVLGERTQLGVRELTDAVHRFNLTRGIVSVDYQPDGHRAVRIEAASGAAAEAREARFHAAASGRTFAVAAAAGQVALSSAGETVTVGAGEESVAVAEAAPTPPRPIPAEILLKVAQASRLGGAAGCLDTTGRTDPGARALVDGEEVEVDPEGRFPIRARARRPEGVAVQVLAPDGRELSRTLPCAAAPSSGIRDLRMRWKRASE